MSFLVLSRCVLNNKLNSENVLVPIESLVTNGSLDILGVLCSSNHSHFREDEYAIVRQIFVGCLVEICINGVLKLKSLSKLSIELYKILPSTITSMLSFAEPPSLLVSQV